MRPKRSSRPDWTRRFVVSRGLPEEGPWPVALDPRLQTVPLSGAGPVASRWSEEEIGVLHASLEDLPHKYREPILLIFSRVLPGADRPFFEAQTDQGILHFRPQMALVDSILDQLPAFTRQEGFKVWEARLRGFKGVRPRSAPPSFTGTPRDYQREGLGGVAFLDEFG